LPTRAVPPDDRNLIERARAGDAQAFDELVLRYERKVFNIAMGMVHDADDAKDVSQEVFLKVHQNLGSYEGDAQFSTWLYRVVVNQCIDHLRRRRTPRVEFDETFPAEEAEDASGVSPRRLGFDPQRALSDKELRQQIRTALEALSPTHRAVLVMRELEGLSYQEMAEVLGCSIGTVMSRLFHARKRMQTKLIEYRKAAIPAA
jgi:RNA polymerase sigma-70 factor (ECF subfamily)